MEVKVQERSSKASNLTEQFQNPFVQESINWIFIPPFLQLFLGGLAFTSETLIHLCHSINRDPTEDWAPFQHPQHANVC